MASGLLYLRVGGRGWCGRVGGRNGDAPTYAAQMMSPMRAIRAPSAIISTLAGSAWKCLPRHPPPQPPHMRLRHAGRARKALPRRKDYEDAADPDLAWAQAVDDATDNFGRVGRGKSTSHEHDKYMWAFGEYLIRQGFGAFVRLVEPGQKAKATSSTGRLAPAYDEDGATGGVFLIPR